MSDSVIVRRATRSDIPSLFGLIEALAEYEQLTHLVSGTAAKLQEDLFGDRPYAEAIVAEKNEKLVGFALFFSNYSTFLTQPGLYIEDIFVLPEYRRQGIGKALLSEVAQEAIKRRVGRLEWSVLDWNESAIAFYKKMGADILPEWRICRMTQKELSTINERVTNKI